MVYFHIKRELYNLFMYNLRGPDITNVIMRQRGYKHLQKMTIICVVTKYRENVKEKKQ